MRSTMKLKLTQLIPLLTFIGINTQAIDLKECRIGPENSPFKVKAECGSVQVAENRENPTRMIDLSIAIVRTTSVEKKPDPVIMLAGGPGQSALDSYPGVAAAFNRILKDRDVVLVDQRGTGGSNIIKCEFDDETQARLLVDQSLIYAEIEKCANSLDADTRYYTTTESIKDLEDVRIQLKIEKWNLLGISYGTRKALTYMKMYPDSIRSVILDGVVPQQEALASHHEENLINALKLQFEQCQLQPACFDAFGDIEEQMWQLFKKVEQERPNIRLQNFMTGNYDEFTFTREYLAIAIRMFAYSANTMNLLPLMISKANKGQLETIASQANMISFLMNNSISNVELSIICAEDIPFYPNIDVNNRNIFGKEFLDRTKKNCAVWPHIRVDPSFKDPVVSDLPVLLLSGELDPVTPPAFADLTAKTLSHSQHLVAKGQGHNVFPLGCMPKIITQFIQDPQQELDIECMDDFDYTPFFINMMGPTQ